MGSTMTGSSLEVPRDVDDNHPLIATHQEKKLEHLSPLVVQRGMPPVLDHEFWNENGDLAVWVLLFDLQNMVEQR